PRIEMDLRLSDQLVNLLDNGVEVAFRIGEPNVGESTSLIVRPLRRYRMIACASPGYLAQAGTPQHPTDLGTHQCIGFVFWNQKVFNEWTFTRDEQVFAVRVDGRFQANNGHAQLKAAVQGLGIFLATEDLVRADLESGNLVRV
ncbi:LysR family transcriptional regulator, partial [Pseudomonas gingeri]|nr:LysR family transcriptional regulator [Pseudomonas gingeri]